MYGFRVSGQSLCVAATHLKSGGAEHEAQRVREMKALMKGLSSRNKLPGISSPCGLVICGDLNTPPDSKVVSLLEQGHDAVQPLKSAYSAVTYTAMDLIARWCKQSLVEGEVTPGFVGVLDYIYVSPEHLQVYDTLTPPEFRLAKGPALGASGSSSGIPSERYPSDHIAIACKLRWICS